MFKHEASFSKTKFILKNVKNPEKHIITEGWLRSEEFIK